MTVLFEPGAALLIIRHDLRHETPKCLAVIAVFDVRQFVRYDILDGQQRRHRQTP